MSLLSAPRAEAVRLIREQLSCVLCGKIFEDPQCLDCKHNFCRDCILQHLRRNNSQCPRCQLPTRPSEVTRNQFLESILAAWKAVESELAQLQGDPERHAVAITVQDMDEALHRALGGSSLSSGASVTTNGGQNGSAKGVSGANGGDTEVTTMQGRGRVANNKWHIDTQEIRHELRLEQPYYPQYRGQHANGSGSSHSKTSSSDLPDDYSGSSNQRNRHSSGVRRKAGNQKKPATVSLAEASAVEAEPKSSVEPERREPQVKPPRSRDSEDSMDGSEFLFPAASQSLQLEASSSQSSAIMSTQEVESYLERITKQREALSRWEKSRKQTTRDGQPAISVMERAMRGRIEFAGMLGARLGEQQSAEGDETDLMTQMSTTASALESPDLLASFYASTQRRRGPRRIEDGEDEAVNGDDLRPGGRTKRRVELGTPPPLYSGRKRLRVPSVQAEDSLGSGSEAPSVVDEEENDGGAKVEDEEMPDSEPNQSLGSVEGEEEYEMKPAVPLVLPSEPENSQPPDIRHGRLSDVFSSASSAIKQVGGSSTNSQSKEKPRQQQSSSMDKWLIPRAIPKPGESLNATMTRTITASPVCVNGSNGKANLGNSKPRSHVFVGTDISREEIKRVLEACQRLGGKFGRDFDLKRDPKTGAYSTSVTHLITKSAPHLDETVGDASELRCKRTAKYMRALAEGCFVVDFSWVLASLEARQWLAEDPFEMVGDIYSDSTGKPREARLRRLQTGRRNDIFSMFRFVVLVSEEEFGFQFASVRSLVEMFGGRVAREADFGGLIREKRQRRTPIGVVSKVTPPSEARSKWQQHRMPIVRVTWIFDSISHLEVLPFDDYYPY